MPKDPRDEALDKIHDIATLLALAYDLPPEVSDYLDIIEALALHRDIPSCVDTKVPQLRSKANRRMR